MTDAVRPITAKRQRILTLAQECLDVDYIHSGLGGSMPRSTIRAHLSTLTKRGIISGG